jgi:hypothetical protein
MRRMKITDETNLKVEEPALDPEAREQQLIALATNLAEKQLLEGTASSQVITHYLKLGSSLAKLEKERINKDLALKEAKTDAIQSSKRIEELYTEAIALVREYNGYNNDEDVF